jgi:hypothetical protein
MQGRDLFLTKKRRHVKCCLRGCDTFLGKRVTMLGGVGKRGVRSAFNMEYHCAASPLQFTP